MYFTLLSIKYSDMAVSCNTRIGEGCRKVKREGLKVETQGTFNAVRFYETLAAILSRKHGVDITVKVKEKPKKEETA